MKSNIRIFPAFSLSTRVRQDPRIYLHITIQEHISEIEEIEEAKMRMKAQDRKIVSRLRSHVTFSEGQKKNRVQSVHQFGKTLCLPNISYSQTQPSQLKKRFTREHKPKVRVRKSHFQDYSKSLVKEVINSDHHSHSYYKKAINRVQTAEKDIFSYLRDEDNKVNYFRNRYDCLPTSDITKIKLSTDTGRSIGLKTHNSFRTQNSHHGTLTTRASSTCYTNSTNGLKKILNQITLLRQESDELRNETIRLLGHLPS